MSLDDFRLLWHIYVLYISVNGKSSSRNTELQLEYGAQWQFRFLCIQKLFLLKTFFLWKEFFTHSVNLIAVQDSCNKNFVSNFKKTAGEIICEQ